MLPRPKPYGLFLLPTCLLLSFTVLAQSRIQGIIVDKSLKTVASANVLLLSIPDSSLVKGSISSPNGSFLFENVAKGRYIVSTTFTGFERIFSPAITIGESSEQVDLGTLSLNQSVSELKFSNGYRQKTAVSATYR